MTFEGDLVFSMVKTLFIVSATLLLLFAFTDFKYSTGRILTLYGSYLLYLCGVSYLCITQLGWVNYMRSCIITIYIPAFALTYFVAADLALQSIFHYATQRPYSSWNTVFCGNRSARLPIPSRKNGMLLLGNNNQRNIRTRSILAFIDNYGVYFDYDKKDHISHLRLLIKAGDGSAT